MLVQDVGGWEGPAVGINGSFAVKDDCLVFETGQVAMTPILPAASRLERTSDGGLAIVLELGGARDTVLLGRSFALAGDVISATAARELSSQVIPDRCPSTVLRTAGFRQ
ncbi:hypothetical protein GRI40_12325 [Altererythrobacter aerius]|uniref:Uncharacterized protein n=1 Tax=Tsuneonella aeria TaxID=1837929 RepID=A0A6I4TFE3_9SPHN|nr:hypothetical protein [Tsuneonella aeria]MXO76002.1 hypothetical protein [Tsuneonella aeria]